MVSPDDQRVWSNGVICKPVHSPHMSMTPGVTCFAKGDAGMVQMHGRSLFRCRCASWSNVGNELFLAARTASVVRSGALVRERVCVRRDTLEISRVSCLCGELHDQASRFRSAIWRVSFLLHFVVDISRLVTFDVPFYLFRDKIPN